MEGKIGGDSLLSPRGMQYAEALPALIMDNIGDAPLTVRLAFHVVGFYTRLICLSGVDVDVAKNDTDCFEA